MRTLAELEQWSCKLNDIQAEISGGGAAEYRSGLTVLGGGGVFSIDCCRETVCVVQEAVQPVHTEPYQSHDGIHSVSRWRFMFSI